MKGKVIIFVILMVLSVLILPSFSYAFRELIEVYKFNFSKLPDNYFLSLVKDIGTYKKFVSVVDPPNVLSWVAFLIILFQQLIGSFNVLKIHDTYATKDTYGSHGTSRWLSSKEMKQNYYRKTPGWFLGSVDHGRVYNLGLNGAYHTVDNKSNLNMQINVVGPPGSDKTTGFVLPNIFNLPYTYKKHGQPLPDLIITDPKSELYCLTSKYLIKMGYDVLVFDFIHLKYGDSINPIDFISEEKELMEIARGYIKSVDTSEGNVKKSGDSSFWDNQETQVLGALIGLVQQVLPKSRQTFTEVAKILTSDFVSNINSARAFFEVSGVTGAPLQLWKNFLMVTDSDRTRANILGGLAVKLSLFAIKGIQDITNKSTIDITQLGAKKDKPIAVFIFMPDGDRTFSPVINVTVSTILNQLYKTAYKYNNKLYTPVYVLFEEIANIGYISGLKEKLGTMRGRRIFPMMIWQDLVQMKDLYGDGWETIVAKCDTQVYLGVNDNFTADYISRTLGNTTINIQGLSRNYEGVFGANKKSESSSYQQRPLLYADECRRLNNTKMILYQRNKYPSLLFKVQYKYWEPDKRICGESSVYDLPLILTENEFSEINMQTVNKVTDKEHIRMNEIERAEAINERRDISEEDILPGVEPNEIDFSNDEVVFTVLDTEAKEKSRNNYDGREI